jgi:aminoglycoside 6'-N-acetyltransferase
MAEPMDDLLVAGGELTIRRLRDSRRDYALLRRWLAEPTVRAWWDPDRPLVTYQSVVDEYREFATGVSPTTGCIISVAAQPIGYMQFYRWADSPDDLSALGLTLPDTAWGLDLFIGDPARVGRGYGKRAVTLLCSYLAADRGAGEVVLITAKANRRAQHVYSSVGFTRLTEVLDRDTKDGQRVPSWAMRWIPPASRPAELSARPA